MSGPSFAPPIFIYEHGDVLVFDDPAVAVRYVEPIDVANGEYRAFDSVGRMLRLEVEDGRVRLYRSSLDGEDSDELTSVLRRFLEKTVGASDDAIAMRVASATLAELVVMAQELEARGSSRQPGLRGALKWLKP